MILKPLVSFDLLVRVELGILGEEIDQLIELLKMLKEDPDQHFHLSSDYKGTGGLGDVTVYVQSPKEVSNMETLGRALAPGEEVKRPRQEHL
jgi:hypothetical protein